MSDPRIDATDVEASLSDKAASKVDNSDLERAVTVGHAIVAKVDSSQYDTSTLELAEAEAAAHWIMRTKVLQTSQESVGSASKSVSGSFGTGLEGTTHGQMLTSLVPDIKNAVKQTATIDVPSVK